MPPALIILVCLLSVWFFGSELAGQSYVSSSHGKQANLPSGCATCHQGHGVADTPMLRATAEKTCYICHGKPSLRIDAIKNGDLSNRFINLVDISNSMQKRFNHFVSTFNSKPSAFQEENTCSSCHSPHYAGSSNPFQGVHGVSLSGSWTIQAQHEYEVCFGCHSQPPNTPGKSDPTFRDIRMAFYRFSAV